MWIRKRASLLAILISFFLVFSPSYSFSQETPPSQPGKFTLLDKGLEAPFDGFLFDQMAVAKILSTREYDFRRFELEMKFKIEKLETEFAAEMEIKNNSLMFQRKKHEEINKVKDKQIEDLNKMALKTDNSVWWAAGGFISGAITVVLLALAMGGG